MTLTRVAWAAKAKAADVKPSTIKTDIHMISVLDKALVHLLISPFSVNRSSYSLLLTPLLFATTDRPFFSYSSSSPLLLVVASNATTAPTAFLPPTLVPLSLPLLHVLPHRTNFFKSSNFLPLLFFLIIRILPRTSSQQATSKQSIKQSQRGA